MDITHFLHKVMLPGANVFRTDYFADDCVNGCIFEKKVQAGKDQEKAQSEKRFPLQKQRWEKTKLTIRYL